MSDRDRTGGEGPDRPRRPEEEGGGREGAAGRDEHPLPGYTDATRGHRAVPGEEVVAHEEALPVVGEHDFEPDVEAIHRPIFREPRDPIEGRERAPWWVWAAAALALFWGGWYLGRHGGTFDATAHIAFAERRPEIAEEAAEEVSEAVRDPIAAGQRSYNNHCLSCHQADGRGVPGTFPPLVGSEWVVGPPETLVRILLHGLRGPIEVAGQLYNGAMPAWKDQLTDAEIAAVATFIRQWDGNDAPPVEPALVASIRQAEAGRREPWTAEELRAAQAAEGGTPR